MVTMTRGYRNCNPGNVRWDNRTPWRGMVGADDKNFVKFSKAEEGYRAMARILRSYEARGLDSVDKIISRWAPHSENDTEGYSLFVADSLGVERDESLDVEDFMLPLLRSISKFENGYNRHTDEVILAGIEMSHT